MSENYLNERLALFIKVLCIILFFTAMFIITSNKDVQALCAACNYGNNCTTCSSCGEPGSGHSWSGSSCPHGRYVGTVYCSRCGATSTSSCSQCSSGGGGDYVTCGCCGGNWNTCPCDSQTNCSVHGGGGDGGGGHTHSYSAGNCITLRTCSCGATNGYGSHNYTASCTVVHCTIKKCTYCGGHQSACNGGHQTPSTYQSNLNEHWKICSVSGCTEYVVARTSHTDTSPLNGICDVCGAIIDVTAPVISLNGIPNLTYVNRDSTVTIPIKVVDTQSGITPTEFTASDITIKVGSTVISPTTKTLTYINESSGAYTYTLTLSGITGNEPVSIIIANQAVPDIIGNKNAETTILPGITADNTKPTVNNTILSITTWTNQDIAITSNAIDTLSGIVAYAYTETTAQPSSWITVPVIRVGQDCIHVAQQNGTYYLWVKDLAGNITDPISVSVNNIDKIKPTINSLSLDKTEDTFDNVTIIARGKDDESGLIAYAFTTSEQIPTEWEYIAATNAQIGRTHIISQNGVYYFWLKDLAGNIEKKSIEVTNIRTPASPDILIGRFVYDKTIVNSASINTEIIIKSKSPIISLDVNGQSINISGITPTLIGDEYTLVVSYVVNTNGIYTAIFEDSNNNVGKVTESIQVFDREKPSISVYIINPTEHSKITQIVFSSNEDVKIYSTSPNELVDYFKDEYKIVHIINVSEKITGEFIFTDRVGNTSDPVLVDLINGVYRYIRTAKGEKVIAFENMSIDNAYKLAQDMENAMIMIGGKMYLYYNLDIGSTDMFMSRARDVGAAIYLQNAGVSKKYDGVDSVQNIVPTIGGGDSSYGVIGIGENNEYMAAYLDGASTKMTASERKYRDVINTSVRMDLYRGFAMADYTKSNGIAPTTDRPFILRTGMYTYTSDTGLDAANRTFRVTLINK